MSSVQEHDHRGARAGAVTTEVTGQGWPVTAACAREILDGSCRPGVRQVILRDTTGRVRLRVTLSQEQDTNVETWDGGTAGDPAAATMSVVVGGAVVATVQARGPRGARAALAEAARLSAARLADAWVTAREIDSLAGEVLRAYEELHLLYELGEALTGQLTVTEVGDVILENIVRALPAAWAELRLADAETPIHIRHAHEEGPCRPTRGRGEHRLSTTLRGGGRTVGGLVLVRPRAAGPFSAANGKLLDAVGTFAGSAIRNAQLRQQVETDPLTGLLNHRAVLERLDAALDTTAPFSLLLIDVDNFKLFNDTYGHLTGDAVLRQVAVTLRAACREGDVAGRYGGDEFVLLLPGVRAVAAAAVARRLTATARTQPHTASDGALIPLSLSIGLACYPADGQTRQGLMALADDAMYRAKRTRGSAPTTRAGADGRGRIGWPPRVAADVLGDSPFGVLDGLVTAVDTKDRYTREHSDDVARRAVALAEALGLSVEQRRVLAIAGLLHDVGKIAVPDHVLRKPGTLTDEEQAVIRRHVDYGVAFIRGVLDDAAVVEAVAHHHERWDGRGYPRGLSGPATPLLGRIMQVADAVSAMMLDRPYRQGLPWGRVVEALRAGADAQFDPALVEPFIGAMESSRRRQRRAAQRQDDR